MKHFLRTGLLALLISTLLTGGASARQTKLIALTFDDGPSREYTTQVLDVLERKQARATFFLVGKWMGGKNDLVAREVAQGHQIANHTFDHVQMTTLSDEEIRTGIHRTDSLMAEITGQSDFAVRPPFGARDGRVLAAIDAPAILWSVDPAAGRTVSAGTMVSRILAKATDGGIILMHDTTQANADAVEGVIDGLRSRGFEFVTVDELFRLKGLELKNGILYQRAVNPDPQGFDETKLTRHWADSSIRAVERRGIMGGDAAGMASQPLPVPWGGGDGPVADVRQPLPGERHEVYGRFRQCLLCRRRRLGRGAGRGPGYGAGGVFAGEQSDPGGAVCDAGPAGGGPRTAGYGVAAPVLPGRPADPCLGSGERDRGAHAGLPLCQRRGAVSSR